MSKTRGRSIYEACKRGVREQIVEITFNGDQNEACQWIMDVPDVGPLTATAAVTIMDDAGTFRSGREVAQNQSKRSLAASIHQ